MNTFSLQAAGSLLCVIILSAPGTLWAQIPPSSDPVPVYRCTIDTKNGTTTCSDYVQVVEQQDSRARANITLCREIDRLYITQAEFLVHIGAQPRGWLFNVGDSPTNNGWAGDWGDGTIDQLWQSTNTSTGQSRDAEMHLNSNNTGTLSSWSVWGNDHTQSALDDHRQLFAQGKLDFANKTVRIVARNEYVRMEIVGDTASEREVNSPYLYALAGQSDFQGPTNCSLHLGINRIIDGLYRVGSGVESVDVILYGDEQLSVASAQSQKTLVSGLALARPQPKLRVAFDLNRETFKKVNDILKSNNINPSSINMAMIGGSDRGQQMVMETLRAEGVISRKLKDTSGFRKALRRFQAQHKIANASGKATAETVAQLFMSDYTGYTE